MKMMKIGGQKMGKIQITKAKDSKEKKDKKIQWNKYFFIYIKMRKLWGVVWF